MTTPVIMDGAAVLIVLGLAAFGAWRGMVKALTGILVVVLAMVGAGFIAARLSGPVTERVVPYVEEKIEERVQARLQEDVSSLTGASSADDGASEDGGLSVDGASLDSAAEALGEFGLSLDGTGTDSISLGQLPALLDRVGLVQETREELVNRVREQLESTGQSVAESAKVALREVLTELLRPIIYSLLYSVSLALLTVVLKLAARSLNNLAKLPVLKQINRAGGFLIGLAEGLLLAAAAGWVMRTVGFTADAPPLADTVLLRFLAEHSLLDMIAMIQPQ